MRRSRGIARLAALLVAGVTGAVLVTGCGAEDGDTAGDPATTPASSASTGSPSPATPTTGTDPDGPKQTATADPSQPPTSEPTQEPTEDPQPPVTTPAVPPPAPDRAPTTYADALTHFRAATDTTQLNRFETPSGNIYCAIRRQYIPGSCELGEGAIPDPAYCGSDGAPQLIGRIEFDHGRPVPVCNSDTIREPGAKVLPYGTVATAAGSSVQCLAEEIGVTCLDTSTRQGFFLARGTYALLS